MGHYAAFCLTLMSVARRLLLVGLVLVATWMAHVHLVAPNFAPSVHHEPTTGMEFVILPPGTFMMGSPPGEWGRQDDEVQHRVQLSARVRTPGGGEAMPVRYLGRYEVTQAEWALVMRSSPSQHADCPRCPVENVSYQEIWEFLGRLNRYESGWRYRLPTEAEWEYACRAGSTTPFHTGEDLRPDQANYDTRFPYRGAAAANPHGKTLPVGSFPPNAWGLYDMHGNVWEWCADWYAPYQPGEQANPGSPASGEKRVVRGGSWAFDASSARCALRYTHAPSDKGHSLGFRLLAEPIGPR